MVVGFQVLGGCVCVAPRVVIGGEQHFDGGLPYRGQEHLFGRGLPGGAVSLFGERDRVVLCGRVRLGQIELDRAVELAHRDFHLRDIGGYLPDFHGIEAKNLMEEFDAEGLGVSVFERGGAVLHEQVASFLAGLEGDDAGGRGLALCREIVDGEIFAAHGTERVGAFGELG